MKQKIKFSTYSLAVTAAVMILFIAGIILLLGNDGKLTVFCIILGITTIAGLYYCPTSIEANESGVVLHRLLSPPKVFSYSAIATAEVCYPSLCGLRLCASGGFFGYWGYFHHVVTGSYIGCYGSRSNCILLKMNDGRQYVLGCDDTCELASYISSHLS